MSVVHKSKRVITHSFTLLAMSMAAGLLIHNRTVMATDAKQTDVTTYQAHIVEKAEKDAAAYRTLEVGDPEHRQRIVFNDSDPVVFKTDHTGLARIPMIMSKANSKIAAIKARLPIGLGVDKEWNKENHPYWAPDGLVFKGLKPNSEYQVNIGLKFNYNNKERYGTKTAFLDYAEGIQDCESACMVVVGRPMFQGLTQEGNKNPSLVEQTRLQTARVSIAQPWVPFVPLELALVGLFFYRHGGRFKRKTKAILNMSNQSPVMARIPKV